jgi:putative ABC transport system permease protein
MNLAVHNLLQDKLRFLLSVLGIALAVMLILFLLGMREGMFKNAVLYLDHAPGSIAVMPAGVKSTGAGSGQFLPPETVEKITSTPGVARATPIMMMMSIPEFHGQKQVIKLVGYDPRLGGGPWDLRRGREPQSAGEVVLDRVIAGRHDFDVGDSFEIGGQQLTVVGVSNQTASPSGSYVFARKEFVERLALEPGAATFVLVTPTPGTSRGRLIESLRALPGTNVLSKSEVMANDQEIVAGILDQIVYLMVAAAFIVGALVVGLVIYTATIERRNEYGILKAIGARNGVLYRVVGSQALIAASAGSLLGVGFAFAMGALVTNLKPQFLVSIDSGAILTTLLAGFVMAMAGAILPARAVTGLAPAEVFRG